VGTCRCGKEMFLYIDSPAYNIKRWVCPHCNTVLTFYISNSLLEWSTTENVNLYIKDVSDDGKKCIKRKK